MLGLAFFESWFPIIVIFAYQYITPVFAYAFNVLFAAIILSFFSLYKKTSQALRTRKGIKTFFLR